MFIYSSLCKHFVKVYKQFTVVGINAIGPYGVVFRIFRSKLLHHPLLQIMAEFFRVQFANTLKYIITCLEDCAKNL